MAVLYLCAAFECVAIILSIIIVLNSNSMDFKDFMLQVLEILCILTLIFQSFIGIFYFITRALVY